jgi:hypothetical protein
MYRSRLWAVWWPMRTIRSFAALAADGDFPLPQVDVAAPQAGQLRQPDAGRGEHRDDRGIAALRKAPARARLLQPDQFLGREDRDQLIGDARRLQPGYRVGQMVFGGQRSLDASRFWPMIDNWDLHLQAEKKSAEAIRTYLEAVQALLAAAVGEQIREVADQVLGSAEFLVAGGDLGASALAVAAGLGRG